MEASFYTDIVGQIKERKLSKSDIVRQKTKLCKKYHLKSIPTDIQILMNTPVEDIDKVKPFLLTKPTRSISGVAVVAIMCKPHKCPHGRCSVCPGGPQSHFGDVPQSYTGREPATMRAMRNDFDPYLQVFNRLEQYIVTGHVPDKVELIVMGGTFPSLTRAYQTRFITDAFRAMNDFSDEFFSKGELDVKRFKRFFLLPGDVHDKEREGRIKRRIRGLRKGKTSIGDEHARNEKAKIRCVGLTLETRPDYGRLSHGNFALELGATRIELGIESVYDDILRRIDRGHDVQTSIDAIRELKDIGFKLNFHFMIGLPGSSPQRDLEGLKELFTDDDFRPDMLKIYPCMVLKGTELYRDFKEGRFRPLTTDVAADVICEFKRFVPKYARIMRIQRDIPTHQTEGGVDRTNLRQYVDQLCSRRGISCNCIRCREVGRSKGPVRPRITVTEYSASCGTEFFIAAEDTKADVLVGFTRLRFPSTSLRTDIPMGSALIRELHVYGAAAGVGEDTKTRSSKSQHQGWGKKLIAKAEEIAKDNGMKKILIISGVGVRPYYRKLGYRRIGPYMGKSLR